MYKNIDILTKALLRSSSSPSVYISLLDDLVARAKTFLDCMFHGILNASNCECTGRQVLKGEV